MNIKKAYEIAAGNYLTKDLPKDWEEMEEEEFNRFIEDNKWEPFANWDAHQVWESIDTLANEIIEATKETDK